MKGLLSLLAASLLALAPKSATAQDTNSARGSATTRSIEGVVTASSGAPVTGGQVLLKDMKSLAVRSFITQADGKYHFYGLSSDIDYEIHAQFEGATSATKNISVFESHKLITLNLKLK